MAEGNLVNELNGSTSRHIVYIDTSLDTHFALMVSDEDTVFDLKKKIIFEHPQDFPDFGEIKIYALKVKRKRYYYHLSNSMLVKSAFIGVNGRWYLSADASSLVEHRENHLPANLNSRNLLPSTYNPSPERNDPLLDGHGDSGRAVSRDLEKEVKHLSGDDFKIFLSDTNKEYDSGMLRKEELSSKENEVVGAHSEHENGIHDIDCTNISGGSLRIGTPVKKKHKKREKNMDVHAALVSKDRLQAETINPGKFLGNSKLEDVNDLEIERKSLSADASKNLDSSVLEKVDLLEGNEITEVVEYEKIKTNGRIEDFQSENSSGEDSQSGCETKKRKIEKDNDTKDHAKQNEDSTSILIPANALIGQQKNINSFMDCLSTEPQEDSHLLKGSSVNGKRKRRKKSVVKKHNQVGYGTSSILENVTKENPKKTQEEDTSREPDSVEKNYHPVQQEENGDMVSHLKLGPESDADGLIQNYSLDVLSTEPLENASLSNTVIGKKKRRKKSSISHIKDAGVPSVKESVWDKISEENHEDEISYDRAVSMKANNSDAVQVGRETMVATSVVDVGIGEHDATLDGLSAVQIERSHSLRTVSGSKKKKRKKKSSDSLGQAEPAVPSSVEHNMEKSPKETQLQNTKANNIDPVRENERGSIVHNSKAGIGMGEPEAGNLNKTVDATFEDFSAGPLDNSNMSTAVSTSGKKKRKKKSLGFHNQIDCTGPSVLENVRGDISGSHEGNYGDLDTEAAALHLEEKHLGSVQEEELETAGTHSKPGIGMYEEVGAGNLVNESTTSTLEAESGGRKISTQKHRSSTEEDFATEQIEKSETEMLLSSSKDHKISPDGNDEIGLSVGKKRKSTKAKNSDVKKQLATGIENDKQEAADVSPAELCEALAGDLSVNEAKKKGENMTDSSRSKSVHPSHLGSESGTIGLRDKELEKTKGNRENLDESEHLVVKKRKSKKARSSIVKKQVTTENVSQEAGYFSQTEPHKALNGDISSNESKKEEKNMTNFWKTKALNVSYFGSESETDKLSREDPSRKTKESLEHLDGKLGSKSKCPEISVLMKQQDVYKETAASAEKLRELESPSNSRWMIKSVKTTSNKQVKSNLETEKEAGMETQSSPNLLSLRKKDGTDDLSRKDPARKTKENLEHLDGKLGSKSKCPEIPVLMRQQDVYKETAASAEKLREVESPSNSRWVNKSVKTTSNKQVKSNLETEKEAGMETKSYPNLLSLLKSDETDELSRKDPTRKTKENLEHLDGNLGSKSKSPEIPVLMKQQNVNKETAASDEKLREVESPSNSRWMNKSVKTTSNKQVKSNLETEKEAGMETKSSPNLLLLQKKDENPTRFSKTTESGVKTVTSSRESALVSSKEKSIKVPGRVEDGNARNGNREMLRNNLTKHSGEVVNVPGRKKSLLAASGTIFKEDSSYSSEDEDGGVSDSDASKKTPSASSSSSDLSQGESESTDVRSKGSGSRGRNLIKPISSGDKHISIEMILRNSSQYKKAKLTASQSQPEDTESQPVDFVPDSQVNL